MPIFVVGFTIGVWILQGQATLPALWLQLTLVPLCLLPLVLAHGVVRAISGLAAGFLYAAWSASIAVSAASLPAHLEGRDLVIEGRILSLPSVSENVYRLDLQAERVLDRGIEAPWTGRMRLSWYRADQPPPRSGERWRFQVRLKRPHGHMNPGGFDYEGWLFGQGITATGYVRRCDCNRRLAEAGLAIRPDLWRQYLRDRLDQQVSDPQARGLIAALTVGDRSGIDSSLWIALRRTGTSHLVAISGLHVGMVSALALFFVGRLWRRLGRMTLRVPSPVAGAAAGLLAALLYAALAGFSLPTQRALVMVATALGAVLLRRRVRPARLLALALLAVLMVDPFGVSSAGLWLSFGAVAVLVYGLAGRVGEVSILGRWGRAQGYLAIGMAPLVIGWFQQASLISPLVNWVAVPWFSLVLVPLSLLSALTLVLHVGVGLVLPLAGLLAGATVRLLEWSASLPLSALSTSEVDSWVLGLAGLGALVLISPRGLPSRWLGAVFFLPLMTFRPDVPPPGGFEATMLDVGQGLSVVVRTHRHTLVFDTGPRLSESFDSGRDLVLPYLRRLGLARMDALVLSHDAGDHAGGAPSLLAEMPARRLLSGEPLAWLQTDPCRAGDGWEWDGVGFEVLSPPAGSPWTDNDASCVIRVHSPVASLLLTGDIERAGEARLVREYPERLEGALVQVPHHGSLTSSTPAFVDALRARYALVSAGYRNRFRFPRAEVSARWKAAGASLLSTARDGAIRVRAYPGQSLESERYRDTARRYWHAAQTSGQ